MKIYNNSRVLVFSILLSALFITSCSKKDDFKKEEINETSEPDWSLTEQLNLPLGDSVIIKVSHASDTLEYTNEWKINDVVVSDADSLVFRNYKAGTYNIEYKVVYADTTYKKSNSIEVIKKSVAVTDANRMYANQLFEYVPAPGQFINKTPGNLASAEGILGKKGMVTLGAFGGSIVLGFDHLVNNTTDSDDIIIYGNASATGAEPGTVWVMEDTNGNGKPDDIWYEIKGSEYGKEGYISNYTVTYTRPEPITADVPWKDNLGNSGVIKTNAFHKQSYFPLWIGGNEYTVKGTLLPSANIDKSRPTSIASYPFAKGYADNATGSDRIDIADAMDSNGNRVNLRGIHFVKIQTGILDDLGWLGELSTEVLGVADLSFVK
ncbi:cell surface protein [Pseudopedobacter sp.]|uniref:cell surface protein n=1 Tax=Pseudopedobacter sp. TaxID=1936787 RepID=UPI00334168D2